jgi:hypothetical protein
MPVVNSFSIAGGCIYVTRKMVDMLGAGFVFLSLDRIISELGLTRVERPSAR